MVEQIIGRRYCEDPENLPKSKGAGSNPMCSSSVQVKLEHGDALRKREPDIGSAVRT